LSRPNQLAAIRTCSGKNSASATNSVIVYDGATGNALSSVAPAPSGTTFQGLSVDRSGGHILVGMVNEHSGRAKIAQVENGRLVTVSASSPTGAQW
jgi:hypothetical protein